MYAFYGKPISSYLKERRVEKTKELLSQSKLSIEEISNAVGCENQGNLAVMFREETSVSPMEYRRLYKAVSFEKSGVPIYDFAATGKF